MKNILPTQQRNRASAFFRKVVLAGFCLLMGLLPNVAKAQTSLSLGTASSSTSYFPIFTCFGYNYSQQVFLASEVVAAGATSGTPAFISSISFNAVSMSSSSFASYCKDWVVYLGNTSKSDFSGTSDWVPAASMTKVFDGVVTPTGSGWFTITFTSPFFWDGVSNIVVGVDENTPSFYCTDDFVSSDYADTRGISYYNDGTNPDPASPPDANVTSTTINDIMFDYTIASPCTGTVVGGTTVASTTAPCPGVAVAMNVTGSTAATGITYQWEFASSGTGPWTDITGETNPTVIVTPSMSTTTYYRRKITCTASSSSDYSTVVSITSGTPLTPPYTEDFEAATVGVNVPCASFTGGWSDGQWWYIRNSSYCVADNHTPGGSQYLLGGYYLEVGSGNQEFWFTPGLNLNAGKTYRFSYWYVNDGSPWENPGTGAYIGTAQTRSAMAAIGPFINTTATTYNQYVTDFTVPADNVYYVGVRVKSTWSCGFGIDDLSLIELPACNTATASTFTTGGKATASPSMVCSVPGSTTLSVKSTPPFSGLSFSWERSTAPNFATVTAAGSTATATNTLTAAGPFYYRCKVTCTATGLSAYSDTIVVNTAPLTPPYLETFESVVPGENTPCAAATNWTTYSEYFNTKAGTISTWGYTDLINHTAGGNQYLLGGYGLTVWTGMNDYWFTPGIELTAGKTYEFSYWYLPDNAPAPITLGSYVGTSQDDWAMNALSPDFNPSNSTYQQASSIYTPTTTGTYYFGIFVQGNTWYGVALDDIGVNELPPCSGKPSSGGIASVTPTKLCSPGAATFSISAMPKVANLTYEWWECDAAGNLISMLAPASISPTYTSGTLSTTAYYRCVVACSLGTATDTTYSTVLQLPVGAIIPPYIETFETGRPGKNMPCADYTYDFGYTWAWNLMGSPMSSWSAASIDNHTPGGSKYLIGGSDLGYWSGSPEFWFTPAITFTAGKLYQLSYWYQTDGEPGCTYELATYMGAAQDRASMTIPLGSPISTTTKSYQEFKYKFTPATSGDFYIGFEKSQTSWGNGIAIDDIGVQEVPPCSAPVIAGTISSLPVHVCAAGGSATLDLIGSTLATGLTYQWLAATSPSGPYTLTTGTTVPYLTDPLPVTTWFKVVITCTASGATDTSDAFKMGVGGFDLPYVEDFESTAKGDVPLCSDATLWSSYYYEAWNVTSDGTIGGSYTNTTPGGKNFLIGGYYLGSPASTSEDNYWFTPGLNLRSGYTYNLSFQYLAMADWSSYPAKMGVYIGNSQSVAAMTTNVATYRTIDNTSFEPLDTTFSVPANGVYYLGFRKSGADPSSIYAYEGVAFDDINLNYAPCDGKPFAGAINSTKPAGTQYCLGATLSLTDIGATINLVPGISYQWQRRSLASPFVWESVLGAKDTVLSADTLVGYEYRFAVICGNTMDTTFSAPFAVPQFPPHPTVAISPATTPLAYCLGDSVKFTATNFTGATYDWMLDSVVIPGWKFADLGAVDPGTYMVRVSSPLSHCPAYSNQVLLVINDPGYTVSITKPADSIICDGTALLLTGTASKSGTSYQWRKDNVAILGATSNSYLVTTSGYYRITATDGSSSCAAVSRNIKITVKPNPPAVIDLPGGTATACENEGVLLKANAGAFSYEWHRSGSTIVGWTDSTQLVKNSGIYSVKVRTADGCVGLSASVTVNILPSPTPLIVKSGLILATSPSTYVSYTWIRNTKDTIGYGSSISLVKNGTYRVVVVDANGCVGVSNPIEIMEDGLSIENAALTEADIKIYPNPTNAKVYIESPVSLDIEVKDIAGRLILKVEDAKQIDLSPYADGTYLFEVKDKNQVLKHQRVTKATK